MPTPLPPSNRDDIRRESHEHVDAIFNCLFPEDASVLLPAFDRIEEQTSQLTQDLEPRPQGVGRHRHQSHARSATVRERHDAVQLFVRRMANRGKLGRDFCGRQATAKMKTPPASY